MNWLHIMNNTLSYIEMHLLDETTIDELAEVTYSSKSYFSRSFSIVTDMNVFDYIRGRRLTLAAVDLKTSSMKGIDVAYKYGYETPEAFSKAFKRLHGVSPSKVTNDHGELKVIPPISFSVVMKEEETMEYRIIEKEAFEIVGLKRRISSEKGKKFTMILEFWQEVMQDGTFDKIQKMLDL